MKRPWLFTFAGVILLVVFGTWPQTTAHGQSPQKARFNPAVEALAQGKIAQSRAVMPRMSTPDAEFTTGGEWTFIDMEHGAVPTLTEAQVLIDKVLSKRKPNGQLMSAPLVRVPMYGWNDPSWLVKQIMDSGALGIMFPQIETKDQALRAVRSVRFTQPKGSKYPEPKGMRGTPSGAAKWNLTRDEYMKAADVWPLNPEGQVMAIIMIETAEGVKNINEILEVPGISAIFIGPNDLGVSLGVGPPRPVKEDPVNHVAPEERAAIDTVATACRAKKVVCGISIVGLGGATPEEREKLISQGYLFLQ